MASWFLSATLGFGVLAVGSTLLYFVLGLLSEPGLPPDATEESLHRDFFASPAARTILQTSESFAGSQFDLSCASVWGA